MSGASQFPALGRGDGKAQPPGFMIIDVSGRLTFFAGVETYLGVGRYTLTPMGCRTRRRRHLL